MLIRSQDKERVVNTAACGEIVVHKGYKEDERFYVSAYFYEDRITLGGYDSKERAKEVLHDIILYESLMKAIELRIDASDADVTAFEDMLFGCYDMPAE